MWASEKQKARVLQNCGVPSRFRLASMDQFPFLEGSRSSLYLFGPAGCGKTHLACAILSEAKGQSWMLSCLFISVNDLFHQIKSAFSSGPGQSDDLLKRLQDEDLLVLDDVGASKGTDWEVTTLDQLIDFRYRENKRTIFTSNLTLQELAQRFDDRMARRIAEWCKGVNVAVWRSK